MMQLQEQKPPEVPHKDCRTELVGEGVDSTVKVLGLVGVVSFVTDFSLVSEVQ